jgi:hypothetical protein
MLPFDAVRFRDFGVEAATADVQRRTLDRAALDDVVPWGQPAAALTLDSSH